MASVEKFSEPSVYNHLRHIERTIQNPSNPDIDRERSEQNYSLAPDRGMTSWDYYQARKAELYCYNRGDVKTMAGWIVTAPVDLPDADMDRFFDATYEFLANRYGVRNVVQAVVHKDESGQPHLHFYFIPAAEDKKHGGEKICAANILNRRELRSFHPDLQRYLSAHGIKAKVYTGVTAQQGGNRTVADMKVQRERGRDRWYTRERTVDVERGRW